MPIGSHTNTDDTRTIDPFGGVKMNARGEWLKQWATLENLVITNTFYDKPPSKQTIYIGPHGQERQIDSILVDRPTWTKTRNGFD